METLSQAQLARLQKYAEKLTSSISIITKAENDGYFLEAIVRIDALLDLAFGYMLAFSCESDEQGKELKLIGSVIGNEKLIRCSPQILAKKKLINDDLRRRVEAWRLFRNTIVHDLFGTWELLEKRGKFDIKNLEYREKNLLKEECIKGRALLRDLIKVYCKNRTNGEIDFKDLHLGDGT